MRGSKLSAFQTLWYMQLVFALVGVWVLVLRPLSVQMLVLSLVLVGLGTGLGLELGLGLRLGRLGPPGLLAQVLPLLMVPVERTGWSADVECEESEAEEPLASVCPALALACVMVNNAAS